MENSSSSSELQKLIEAIKILEFFEDDHSTFSFFYYTPFGQYANVFPCVYEHLRFEIEDKVMRLLSNVSFLLKPGGYFFGITPNLSTIWYEKVIGKYRCFWICIFSFFYPGYCYTC
ncbi:hypothetical protein ES332_D01G174200v1 [Gossypium tomentosum]|uniref:Uncharacterized protein n=1 Tax=Gossypium tomentosum TaxID=34277 RepID=A0A5D2MA37_GOSTO|nr:hypothetical protein ES332_D01G174200v1 [Gossypium tomentosum]